MPLTKQQTKNKNTKFCATFSKIKEKWKRAVAETYLSGAQKNWWISINKLSVSVCVHVFVWVLPRYCTCCSCVYVLLVGFIFNFSRIEQSPSLAMNDEQKIRKIVRAKTNEWEWNVIEQKILFHFFVPLRCVFSKMKLGVCALEKCKINKCRSSEWDVWVISASTFDEYEPFVTLAHLNMDVRLLI